MQAPTTLTGTTLGGRYRVGAMLGEGGMGAVYEGVQEGLDRKVALKVLHPHLASDAELRGRFQREAHVVAMLGHPNVVQISDFQANDDEPPFLVMELLHGENLRDVLKRTPRLPPERVAYIAVQVLSALEAAHRASIVHRDVKPDNIFLERTSVQADIVKVLDFGVAKLVGKEEAGVKLTRAGLVVGTLSYMSPEQASGDPIDGRADLYSLAASMYVALAGRRPFEGASTATLLRAIMTEPPVPLATVRRDVDAALSHILDRALAKRPEDRFASAAEMARALAPHARPTPLDPPASALPPTADPATPVMTVRTPGAAMQPLDEPIPKTLEMTAMTAMMPESVAPRTTPLPPPRTQRSSYHPPAPAPSFVPVSAPARSASLAPWIVALALAAVVLVIAGATVLAVTRPWQTFAASPAVTGSR